MRLVNVSLTLGLVAAIVSAMLPAEGWPALTDAVVIAVVFAVLAGVGAFILKREPATIGLLALAPLGLLLLMSVAFAGNLAAFVQHDLLPLGAAAAGALGGAQIGARLSGAAGRAA